MPKKRYNVEEIIHPRPAYLGGFQPAPSGLEKSYNYLNLLLIR